MSVFALTRTCALDDFVSCRSVAEWQQRIADAAYARWCGAPFIAPAAPVFTINWSGALFRAPGVRWVETPDPPTPLGRLAGPVSAIFALSVLDRVEAPLQFLSEHGEALLPGGLLFCTFACWNANGKDVAVGHEIRQRIYQSDSVKRLIQDVRRLDLYVFGGSDWRYHGNLLGDHTLGTLVLTKGER